MTSPAGQTEPGGKVKAFFSRCQAAPPPQPARPSAVDAVRSAGGANAACAEELAGHGAWGELLQVAAHAEYYPLPSEVFARGAPPPGELAARIHLHAVALLKTGQPAAAFQALQRLTQYKLTANPADVSDDGLRVVRFSTRLLRCQLDPNPAALTRLLAETDRRLAAAEEEGEAGAEAEVWRRRRDAVRLKLVLREARTGGSGAQTALHEVTILARDAPESADAAQVQAGVLLQCGEVDEAVAVAERLDKAAAAAAAASAASAPQLAAAARAVRGLVAISGPVPQPGQAAACYDAENGGFAERNNRAVCAVHSGRLPDAIAMLEAAVAAEPTVVNETLVQNLFSLYGMVPDSPDAKKEQLFSVVEAYRGAAFAAQLRQRLTKR